MKALFDTLFTWCVGGTAALLYAASSLLDRLPQVTGLSSATWLLISFTAVVLAFIVAGVLSFMAMHEANHDDICRTANTRAIDRDVRRTQAMVPSPSLPAGKRTHIYLPGRRAGKVACLQDYHRINVDLVTRLARVAAEHDHRRGDNTPNPHQKASRAYATWSAAYDAHVQDLQESFHQPATAKGAARD